ncbi:MAG TPA: response regulator [Terriglobia bacterium]|nr:response regulator [Terriglobia bacterium]
MAAIVAVVEDLFFLSKIQQTAKVLGIAVEPVAAAALEHRVAAGGVNAVILDLNDRQGAAVDLLRRLKSNPATAGATVIGFLSHVQTDLAAAARAAGCDVVLARSGFTRDLPQLLEQYALP